MGFVRVTLVYIDAAILPLVTRQIIAGTHVRVAIVGGVPFVTFVKVHARNFAVALVAVVANALEARIEVVAGRKRITDTALVAAYTAVFRVFRALVDVDACSLLFPITGNAFAAVTTRTVETKVDV